MKKKLVVVFVVLMTIALLIPETAFADPGGDGYDLSADSFVTLYDTDSVSGTLTLGDSDYFMIVPEYTVYYTFVTTGSTDTKGYLYNSSGRLKRSRSGGGADTNFSITYKLTSGQTYYLKVMGQTTAVTGTYTLEVTHAAPARSNCGGNLIQSNMGFACANAAGTTIYYSNTYQLYRLYKINTNGTGKRKLCNDMPLYINVVGSYVYYVNANNGFMYRIKTNGSGRRRLTTYGVKNLIIVGDWAYFIRSDSDIAAKMRLSRPSETYGITDHQVSDLNVYNDHIYFSDMDDGNRLYMADLKGNNVQVLNYDQCSPVVADDTSIYYIDYNALSHVYSIGSTGMGPPADISGYGSAAVNYSAGWIYFANESDGGKLYRITNGGIYLTKLSDTEFGVKEICVAGSYVYYKCEADDRYYRVKTDGTGGSQVAS
jgi:hypothetical protein